MRRVFAVICVLGLVVGGLASPFVHGPYSGDPTQEGVTICWTVAPPLPARVEFSPWQEWSASGVFPQWVDYFPRGTDERELVHLRLAGLSPATRYAYRVVLQEGELVHESPVGSFYTTPGPGTEVAFCVLSDTQWRGWTEPNRIELVGDAIAADPTPFQFILHAGDVVEHPFRKYWDHLFVSLSDALLRAPFLPVLGNHERGSRSYYEQFDLPPGGGRFEERWWAFQWGDIIVVGLDSNATRPTELLEQADWLREHLAQDYLHKFVIFHHPVFSSRASWSLSSPGLAALWHPIFVEYGVDIVFNGHAHNYERIEQDGINYLVVGGGGGPLYPLAEDRVPGSQVGYDEFHFYLRVFTSPKGIEVEVVKVARVVGGEVIPEEGLLDRFYLPAD